MSIDIKSKYFHPSNFWTNWTVSVFFHFHAHKLLLIHTWSSWRRCNPTSGIHSQLTFNVVCRRLALVLSTVILQTKHSPTSWGQKYKLQDYFCKGISKEVVSNPLITGVSFNLRNKKRRTLSMNLLPLPQQHLCM